MLKLVGDNPFQGVSHLSRERVLSRGGQTLDPDYAAKLIQISLENGAEGFMFSVDEMTLSTIRTLRNRGLAGRVKLYALTPAAYNYVRLMGPLGINGVARRYVKSMISSGNVKAIIFGSKGIISRDPESLIKSYLNYEISRVKAASDREDTLESMLLHEIITDMALSLELRWLFKLFIDFMKDNGVAPGFETRNFSFMVNKFREWDISLDEVLIAAPFNKIGFQMNPSKTDCEKALISLNVPNVIAMSVLAAGYLKPEESIKYVEELPNLRGVCVGISNEHHAKTTFRYFKSAIKNK